MINVQFNLIYQRQLNENIQVKIFLAGEFNKPLYTAFLNAFNVASVKIPIDLIQKGITYTYSASQSVNFHMYPLPREEVNSDIYLYDDWPYPHNLLWKSMLISRLYQRQISYDISNIYQNNQVNISFSVQVPLLAKNQLVYLLGNHEQLGGWREENKLLLYNPNKSSNVFQSLFITLPNQKTQIKYKYLLMDKVTGKTIYEDGQDRTIDVVVPTNQLIQAHSFFRYQEFKTPKLFGVKVDLYAFKYKKQFFHIDIYDLVMLIPFFKETGTKMICPLQIMNDDGFFNTDFIAVGLLDALSPELLSEIEVAVDIDDYQKHQYLLKNFEDHFEKNIVRVNQYLSKYNYLKVYTIYKYLQQKDLHLVDARRLLNDSEYCDEIYKKFYEEDHIKLTFIAYEQIIMYQQIKFVFEEYRKNNISLQIEWQYSRVKHAFMEKIVTFQQFIGINLASDMEQFLVDYKTNTIIQTNFYVRKKSVDFINIVPNEFVDQLVINSVDSIVLKDFSLYYSGLIMDQYGRTIPSYQVNMKYECLDNIKRYSLVLFQKYQLGGYDQRDIDELMERNIIVFNEQYQLMQLIYNDIPIETLSKTQIIIFKDLYNTNVLLQYHPQTDQYIPNYAYQSTKQFTILKDSQRSELNDYVMKYLHCLQEKQLESRHRLLEYLCQYDMQFIMDDKLNDSYYNAFYDNIFLTSKTHIQHIGNSVSPFEWDYSYYTQIQPYNDSLIKMWQNKTVTEQYLKLQLNKQDMNYYYADIKLSLFNIFEKYLYSSSFIVVMHLSDILILGQPVYNEELNFLSSEGNELSWKKYSGNIIFKSPRLILPTQNSIELIQILRELLEKSKRYD